MLIAIIIAVIFVSLVLHALFGKHTDVAAILFGISSACAFYSGEIEVGIVMTVITIVVHLFTARSRRVREAYKNMRRAHEDELIRRFVE